MNFSELAPNQLYHRCDPGGLSFETTNCLEDVNHFLGPLLAVKAVHFGFSIQHEGYNLFTLGEYGMGKFTLISIYRLQAIKYLTAARHRRMIH